MIKKIGIILLAVVFLGSMAWTPVFDSVQADVKAAQCGCGKDCQCDHCKTGKGECSCKAGAKGCSCKADGKGGCNCGKDCNCGHCGADHKDMNGKQGMHGKGCSCGMDAKGGCHCGKDCKCEHCKTGKGTCSCKGDGKGGCSCGKGCSCGHCAMAGNDASAKKPTSDADYAKTMKSKTGTFNVSYMSDPEAIAANKIMSWKLKVETADNKAVKDAEITVEGTMPEHGHGMPTQPKVKNNGDGTYLVEGIKFSMTGWWTVTFTIKAGGKTDMVTFNLQF